ncbi:beta-galactosidase [Micromonospora sp. HM5-17]|jgi:beta-galactosidase|uniref:beta-galactosidase n=1 Tax=Micromonospora sp. HM5-17 TaxID=2487710 RepID=UPI000F470E4F|nr:beta-galactosidase [Micromonospora sp. HM5-17]ROT31478.1 beta-galactosidase [Micromonospora sp. HM5-17]
MGRLVPKVSGLSYGGDYNPEQWPEEVWPQDVALMREAGVNLVTVAVFGWAWLEPAPGAYTFDRLDRIMDGLHAGGIRVCLATATASPPPWFSYAHPETLPVDADGRRLTYGSRQAICPSSPVYRQAALALTEQLARRYHDHPALALWHVHNEYACHNAYCYCDTSAAAFRDWLQRRYGDLDALNAAWGTAFWSQTYTDWAQVQPPRATPTSKNPGQVLDFRRFSSAEHLANFVAERDVLHALAPGIPVTTNLMTGSCVDLDYWAWGREMTGPDRLVSNDHYILAEHPLEPPAQIAFAADLARSLAGGPWLLMEHSTSAVNWQPRNLAKPPGQLIRDSLAHVARGSEGALYFQWRASRAGSEKWHSAMVPHAGTESKIWREVVTLGGHLRALAEVEGARTEAEVAVLLDYASVWAQEAPNQPSVDMVAFAEIQRWHAALWRAGITADLAPPDGDLGRYRLVVAPALYLMDDDATANLTGYVAAGGTLVVGPYSGLVDAYDRVRPAPLPGALADLLGIRVEEFFPLPAGGTVRLVAAGVPDPADATDRPGAGRPGPTEVAGLLGADATAAVWTEQLAAPGAEVLARYADGPVAGAPALTRRTDAGGPAWYLGTRPDDATLGRLLAGIAAAAGVRPVVPPVPGVEAVRRRHPDGRSYLFLLNHGDQPAEVAAAGTDLLTGDHHAGSARIPARGVVVLAEDAGTTGDGR